MKNLSARTILFIVIIISLATAFCSGFLIGTDNWSFGLVLAALLIMNIFIFLTEMKISVNEERVTREELVNAMWEYNVVNSWHKEELVDPSDIKFAEKQVDSLIEIIKNHKINPIYPRIVINEKRRYEETEKI